MSIYERIKELYEKAEQEAAEERDRQQRETELLRAASRVAEALQAHGVKAADAPIPGWLIHTLTLPPSPQAAPSCADPSPRVQAGAETVPHFGEVSVTPNIVQYTKVQHQG